jgi:DNA uptake protein ComE-like DNA-binding protein
MNRPALALVGAAALLVTLAACTGDAGDDGTTTDSAAAIAPSASDTAGAPAAGDAQSAFLDPNAATEEQLAAVPGVDTAAAAAIVGGRPYADMLAVDRVLVSAGLSEQQRDTVYTRLWRPLDLNSASAEEIMLIPGVGARMRHEFEEYRPYRSIGQFRREIGKYVDTAEVARLERYVTIR